MNPVFLLLYLSVLLKLKIKSKRTIKKTLKVKCIRLRNHLEKKYFVGIKLHKIKNEKKCKMTLHSVEEIAHEADQISTTNPPDQISIANSPDQISIANSPDQISSANSPDQISSANSPDQISSANSPDQPSQRGIQNRAKLTNLILIIDYDGTNYSGWTGLENESEIYLNATKNYKHITSEKKKNEKSKYKNTVQNTILNCILRIHGYGNDLNKFNEDISTHLKPFDFIGVSRTDKGVHAKEYVCQYISYEKTPPCEGNMSKIKKALNSLLNKDIKIIGVLNAPFHDFNVRYNNCGKIYTYNFDVRIPSQPLERNYAWQLYDDPRFSFLLRGKKAKKRKIKKEEVEEADVEEAGVEEAGVEEAGVEEADVHESDVQEADVHEADVQEADVHEADVHEADVQEADVHEAEVEEQKKSHNKEGNSFNSGTTEQTCKHNNKNTNGSSIISPCEKQNVIFHSDNNIIVQDDSFNHVCGEKISSTISDTSNDKTVNKTSNTHAQKDDVLSPNLQNHRKATSTNYEKNSYHSGKKTLTLEEYIYEKMTCCNSNEKREELPCSDSEDDAGEKTRKKNKGDVTHCLNIIKGKGGKKLTISCDIDKIKKCSKLFIGYHNFECFRGTLKGTEKLKKINTFCNIYFLDLYELKSNIYQFVIQGDRFLYHMIRIIVGTLLQVGVGLLQFQDVWEALYLSKPLKVKLCAPPHGLCLSKILFCTDVQERISTALLSH
ncbi:tRNA pseudouridine synthase [Plasmodium gonderi]|uniref:tRNA pseudouridine synthase n=1 Tax=Plasmodium gonderi TaxID=77519 RepID=A0A1Y1JJ45_PLAGO|nr:tRNA pseudouridine synthase [Plasmodium gonderi]GAW81395.1 tRNA pseudouridine synthase [Plasmodium gonderi]